MGPYLEICSKTQLDEFYAEFGATRDSVHRDVQYLKEWIKKEPHLPDIDDDEWLSNFLLRCKNSIEKTKSRIDFYFCTRAMLQDFFNTYDIRSVIEELKLFTLIPMPKLTPEGNRIVICHISEHKGCELPSGDTIMLGMQFLYDYLLKRDKVRAVTFIYDGGNISMALAVTLLQSASKHVLVQSKVNPIRYNKVYAINMPSIAQPLISFIKPFIKKESEKLILWKNDVTKLSEELPRNCLPKEYGGSEPPLSQLKESFYKEVEQYHTWLDANNQLMADLTKKENHVKKNENMYGVEGSFRKLCVD